MDIDSFRQANDCHGPLYGDKILVARARNLESVMPFQAARRECVRRSGSVIRPVNRPIQTRRRCEAFPLLTERRCVIISR